MIKEHHMISICHGDIITQHSWDSWITQHVANILCGTTPANAYNTGF